MPSEPSDISVSVIHLIWVPFGLECFESFVSSYKAFPAGYPHQLVLLFNGVDTESVILPFHQYARQQGLEYTAYYKKDGLDLAAYFWLAPQLKSDYLLFLNSYARLLADNWLAKYTAAVKEFQENLGAVCATGSYQSYYSTILHENSWRWNAAESFSWNFRKYKLLVKTKLLYRFYFNPFPNPHIRTNAFFINRDVFVSLTFNGAKTKLKAYLFENGKNSLTNQLLKSGRVVLVMDKHGRFYKIGDWYQSKTFWTGNQQNLLVSDNQTMKFIHSDAGKRKELTYKAWGIYE